MPDNDLIFSANMIDGNYLINPNIVDIIKSSYIHFWYSVAGAIVSVFISFMRMRFFWFPLDPVALAVSQVELICGAGWIPYPMWGSFFIAWLIKSIVFRYGGAKLYQGSIGLFMGLAVGYVIITVILAVLRLPPVWPLL